MMCLIACDRTIVVFFLMKIIFQSIKGNTITHSHRKVFWYTKLDTDIQQMLSVNSNDTKEQKRVLDLTNGTPKKLY